MRRPDTALRLSIAAVTVALCCAGVTDAALGYRVKGTPWPGGLIPYYNAAHDQAWAVSQAVNAWNTSGARVRFVPVSRAAARLVIEESGSRSCQRAEATVGYGRSRTVRIWGARAVPSTCTAPMAATALAHELGHVLGLRHEDRGCAAMNSTFSARGPGRCERVERWEWRCRLLEHDDVAGAVAVYGGSVRPLRAPSCPLYEPIAPPRFESAVLGSGFVSVRLRRPASPRIPSYLIAALRSAEAYALAWGRDTCPSRVDLRGSSRFVWPQGDGETVEIRRPAPAEPGLYCLAIWSVDSFVRPSARPLTISVRVS